MPPSDEDESGGGGLINWRFVYARLAEKFGWGPDRILPLTIAQVKLYLGDVSDVIRRKNLSPSEAKTKLAKNKEQQQKQRQRLVDELTGELLDAWKSSRRSIR